MMLCIACMIVMPQPFQGTTKAEVLCVLLLQSGVMQYCSKHFIKAFAFGLVPGFIRVPDAHGVYLFRLFVARS